MADEANQKKYTLYAVTKTHWDREWYMNFQKSRIKLVHLIDSLLDLLDNDPDFVSFMMDGQTLPLDDYLAVKPYNRERLTRYIREGRIVIGPWYILPDEILITGESHIRNYLLGTRVAKEFGVDKMQVGYLPDSFGHPSQMPQILSKLGMDTIIFWRGATQEVDRTEFYWRAPDGTRVLTVLMPDGYFTGAELSEDGKLTAQRLDNYISNFAALSTTDKIYLSNGGDHLEPVKYLSGMLKEANKHMKNGRVIHTTLPRFVHDLQCSLGDDLKELSGELCGVSRSILLFSTLSTRTYLKQANHKASRQLENELEPIFSISALMGGEYPRDILLTGWKYLMENLPHDSICGCSVDDIHTDMMFRYNQVTEIADHMLEVAGKAYQVIDTQKIQDGAALCVINTTGNTRSDYIQASVDFDPRPTSINDYNRVDAAGQFPAHLVDDSTDALKPLPKAVRVFDGDVELPCALLDAQVANWMDLDFCRFPHQYNVNRCQIALRAVDVPAMGYKTLRVVPVYEDQPSSQLPAKVAIGNEYFTVEPNLTDGSITLTDRKTGRVYAGLNRLADGGDCGDEYTFCPPDEDRIVFADPATLKARMVACDAVRQVFEMTGVMRLPIDVKNRNQGRADETVDCAFTSVVSLYAGVRRVDVCTTFDNKAKYHRVRALFPTSVKSAFSHSAGTFSVDERPLHPALDPNWKELYFTHPQKDFCELNDGQFGLTVANRGLHEFEAYDDGDQSVLAVTLLRCTGLISQRVLSTRKEMGGWSEPAPEGQCIGTWSFEYSIIPHAGDWVKSKSFLTAHEYNLPMKALQLQAGVAGAQPDARSMIDIDNDALIVSAFKQCEFEDGFVFRFYNTTPDAVAANVRFRFPFASVRLANLREDTIGAVDMQGRTARLDVKPFEIVTLKINL